jgi:DNA-binding GntR family transcriptional regulator
MTVANEAHGKNLARPDAVPAQSVADWLREGIRRSRFVPGQRLVEADITQATGASRSKVREALQRLETEGLVQIEEFKGASVRRVSLEQVRQIYRARIALEGISARDFAANASAAARARLSELMRELDEAVAQAAPDRFNRLNAEWHELLVEGSGNALVAGILGRLNIPIQRLLFESLYNHERLKAANVGHHEVTAAIIAGDGDAAEAALRRHIEDGFATLAVIDSEFRGNAA